MNAIVARVAGMRVAAMRFDEFDEGTEVHDGGVFIAAFEARQGIFEYGDERGFETRAEIEGDDVVN